MHDDAELDLVLANYLAGHLPPAERAVFEQRMARDPVLRQEVALARRICNVSSAMELGDADAVWARVQGRMVGSSVQSAPRMPSVPTKRRTGRRSAMVWRLAAAVVLSLGAGLVWRSATSVGHDSGVVSHPRTYVTSRGERTSFRLPDGTQVVLGPASRLLSSVSADHGPRIVTLDGLAYLVVKHDPRRPFSVRTAHGVARDLGTRFVVDAYGDAPELAVAVAEGSVAIAAPNEAQDSLVLTAGNVGRVIAGGRLVSEHIGSPEQYLAWTEGRLEFNGVPLGEVVARLGRWYDIDVRLANPELRERRVAASFKDESAREALQVIAAIAGLQIEQQGSTVVLRSK